jgi:DNA-binding CsgD family transcriptional regulator
MLQGSFQAVVEVQNREEFRAEVIRFAQHLGFSTVAAASIYDQPDGSSEFVAVDNTPAAYLAKFEALGGGMRDPVMQHCKRSGRPIIWDQSTYLEADAVGKWEEQAVFGYRSGIAMALHMPEGRHFMFGVDLDGPLTRDAARLSRTVADLQLFAVYAQEAASRILLPTPCNADVPNLTRRELEALRWTLEGKTAWEVGKILSIAERTAVFHVNNAMHKLGCVSKHQAAVRADRLGLLR